MEDKPYFCPNCRSNRVKFSVISSYSRRFLKDAMTGAIQEISEPDEIQESEPTIQCQVCSFTGNELRFIKQAERDPRMSPSIGPTYS